MITDRVAEAKINSKLARMGSKEQDLAIEFFMRSETCLIDRRYMLRGRGLLVEGIEVLFFILQLT